MEPEQLLADLDRELRSVLGALQAIAPVTHDVTVADGTGAVRVTVRPDATLVGIVVAPAWSEQLEAESLASVIDETLGRAQAKAMGFDIDALGHDGGASAPAQVDDSRVESAREALLKEAEQTLFSNRTEAELQRRMDELPGIADTAMARLEQAMAGLRASTEADLPQDPAEFTPGDDFGDFVESGNRMVGVRVVSGLVAEVRIKENWLERRSGNVLTGCFNEIIDRLPEVAAAQRQRGGSE